MLLYFYLLFSNKRVCSTNYVHYCTSLYDSIDVATACIPFTSSVEEGRSVCPGEELTYTCTILGGAAVWRVPCGDAGALALAQTKWLDNPPVPVECGNFSAAAVLTVTDSDCYTSTLSVTASPELNATHIACEDSSKNVVGNATILLCKSTPSRF